MAQFTPIGEPVNDAERQALRFLADNLPDDYHIYGTPWIVERGRSPFELGSVVVAPHAIFVVDFKNHRGTIQGNDHDWYLPEPTRSPIKTNRLSAQILASRLGHGNLDARPYVEHFVFLSHASAHRVSGPVSNERVHVRTGILQALQDDKALHRRVGERPPVDAATLTQLDTLLMGVDRSRPPARAIREWELTGTLDRTDRHVEYSAVHRIDGRKATLRVYEVPMLGVDGERRQVEDRFQWEAQVLRRISENRQILRADAPFTEGASFVLPFEAFPGITLGSWLDKYGPKLNGAAGVDARIRLWRRIAEALHEAHTQGIVHRLLRPEVILVADDLEASDLRVTGFELAKQLHHAGTVVSSALSDDRRRFAAPEVVRSFSDADARSDQFSLGALLGHILIGRPLFDSTEEMTRRGGVFTRIRDVNASFKLQLDRAVVRMLEVISANRFPDLREAIDTVVAASKSAAPELVYSQELDPENIPENTRIGPNYEITGLLGRGGLATVYRARHLVSGTTRALKVARSEPRALAALHAEHQALRQLRHPHIVGAIDLISDIPGRTTLVLERVHGKNLAERLREGPFSFEERQRYAEHLFSALTYLEEQRVTHKDIKPENLIVGDEGLTVIDFSLVGEPPEATVHGTALYRDPALVTWGPEADRYAAALCLYEIYVGRHAFDGQAPQPGEDPRLDPQDLDRPALVEFFRKALGKTPALRHPSAQAMRHDFQQALGQRGSGSPTPLEASLRAADAPLSLAGLSERALTVLRRAGLHTQGALVALDEAKIASIPGLGHRRLDEVLVVRRDLLAAGVTAAQLPEIERRSIFPTLIGDERPVQALKLSQALHDALAQAGLSTVGRLADATRDDLRRVNSIGKSRITQIVQALQRLAETGASEMPATLDGLWDHAASSLSDSSRVILERLFGLRGGPSLTQVELAQETSIPQATLSVQRKNALDSLDGRLLEPVVDHLESILVSAGGVLRIDRASERLCERWPVLEPDNFDPCGLLRLAAVLAPLRVRCDALLDEQPGEVLTRPGLSLDALRDFLMAARQLAGWPPKDAEAARRSLQVYLPEYPHDLLGLATQLEGDLRLSAEGELFESPVNLSDGLLHVLRKARLPIRLPALRQALVEHFGDALTPEPAEAELARLLQNDLHRAHCYFDPADGTVHPPNPRSIIPQAVPSDLPPPELRMDPGQAAVQRLCELADRRGFRLIVTPPRDHLQIARSVAQALGPAAVYLSFADAFFRRHEAEVPELERAERFAAQRPRLRRAAEATLDALLTEHGRPGARIVLADTGLLGLCDALHLVRRVYDQTHTGGRGFWALVIPGVVRDSQPLFNEAPGANVFSLPNTHLQIAEPLPAPAPA